MASQFDSSTKFMASRYDHRAIENSIYARWEKSGYFNPDNLPYPKSAKPYCIIMPPPNANGLLHMGHALFVATQDIIIRYKRMRGFKTLWLPGADHAGFETQVVYAKKLEKEGRKFWEIPREELYKEILDFTLANKAHMERQLKALGASCDWSRGKFTLDQEIVKGVRETFFKLRKSKLIYREIRVINWCTKHRTSLSDLEVKYLEKKDPLYFIKYGPLVVATVRPETKLGDMALAVNPKDSRYQNYVGKIIKAKDVLGEIQLKVIADEAIDPSFGTGVVKVTPAHDSTDFEIWCRHKEEISIEGDDRLAALIRKDGKLMLLNPIIGKDGLLTELEELAGKFRRMKVAEARAAVVKEMQEIGILEKTDPEYIHQVATCYKCNTILEPLPEPQWYIKMESFAKKAIEAVKKKKIVFYPKSSEKVYFHWLNNIRDWNISRQIVWGIRIPAWSPRNPNPGELTVHVGEAPPSDGREWDQDPDVFDTWFSSGQWPFLVLGFREDRDLSSSKLKNQNEKKSDFEKFYPTDVMETGHDILFFWVARMIMLGLYRTGKVPFKHVYLHGLVRDKDRQKMSKSRGNVLDPLGVADEYGTDAVRMALVSGNAAGTDPVISEEKIRGYRNFGTKIWNMAKFALTYKDAISEKPLPTKRDKEVLKELETIKKEVAKNLDSYKIHIAAELAYHYVWHTVADKIIEEYKPRLKGADSADKTAAASTLTAVFCDCLKMLHPFMPFITEELYGKFRPGKMLMIETW